MSQTVTNSASSSPHWGLLVRYASVTLTGAAVMVLKFLGMWITGPVDEAYFNV